VRDLSYILLILLKKEEEGEMRRKVGPIFQVCLRHYNNNNSHLPRAMSTTSTGTRRQHQVVHLPKEHKFVIRFEDGDEALVEYEEREGGRVWDFVHTFTPPSKRGQGLAAQVVSGAMEHVKAEGKVKVTASCWYVRDDFLPRHPEYADCLANKL